MASTSKFYELLAQQVGNEFGAQQEYIASAVFYDHAKLPQLAKYFYNHAVEERNHAMMIIQYFLDRDILVEVPAIPAPKTKFKDSREPIADALEREKVVTDQIVNLVKTAREEGDFLGERFMYWFLEEQVEEVATMTSLLRNADRKDSNEFDLEDFVARQFSGKDSANDGPEAAGGKL
jgi:ferritin